MKKNILKATFVAAFALFAGYNVYTSQKSDVMSDLALANVEALASGEWGTGFNCRWDSNWHRVCDGCGFYTGCPCGSHNW